VIVSKTLLGDVNLRGRLVESISDLPVDNIWIRVSGIGPLEKPLALKKYLHSLSMFHNSGKPIVLDYVSGLTAWAALSFGVVGGISHGVLEKERFDASDWYKVRDDEDRSFGRSSRFVIPGMYRSVTSNELDLLASARGGRRLCACLDRSSCPHGYEDMKKNSRRHVVRQFSRTLQSIEATPDLRRETYFFDNILNPAAKKARLISQLRPSFEEAIDLRVDAKRLMKRMDDAASNLEAVGAALENYVGSRSGEIGRSPVVGVRAALLTQKKSSS
jgi:hypothetical protein